VHQAAFAGTNGSAWDPLNCTNCHSTAAAFTTTSWTHASEGWALPGNHQMAPAGVISNCNQCHTSSAGYTINSTACYSPCHTTDWLNTQTLGGNVPNHVSNGYPQTCDTCHDTVNWANGTFNHTSTGWALTGVHATTACNLCHTATNGYTMTITQTACDYCHDAEYQSTSTLGGSVPDHTKAGYPKTCDSCHTTTTWLGATFNHTYFPIPHHSSVCGDCHQSTDYSQFTCINCHTATVHRGPPGTAGATSDMNNHPNVNGGNWFGATTCYNCHQNGGG